MDEGYQDGEAMLLLAQSYEKQGEQDKANAYYQKIIEEHEGTQAATDAQEAHDTQNAQKSKKNNNQDMDCPGIEMAEIQKEKDIHVRGVCPFLVYALCKIIERCKWGVIT